MISAFVLMPYNPGDVLMALQAIQEWHHRHPDSVIDFIVGEDAQDLVLGIPWLRQVIPLPRQLLRAGLSEGQGISQLQLRLKQSLEPLLNQHYDLGINLFQGRWGAYLTALVSTSQRVGLGFESGAGLVVHTTWMRHLMALPVQREAMPVHAIDFYRLALEEIALGSNPSSQYRFASLSTPTPTVIFPRANKPAGNITAQPKAILHPGSAWLGKRWPITHWVTLSQALLQAGWQLTITGSREESSLLEAWPAEMRQGFGSLLSFHFGSLTWTEFVALGKQNDWMISGDTVAMHLGAATGCRVLALFGASNPRETGPYGSGHFVLETEKDPYPANLSLASSHGCLIALQPQSVADFLLRGQAPPAARLWETRWLPWGLQGLCNAHGQWAGEKALNAWWNSKPDPASAKTEMESRPLLGALQAALNHAQSQVKTQIAPPTLQALEKAEQDWAAATRHLWVWESYRIALNGIPLFPLASNLQARADLLYKTMQNEGRTLRKSLSGIAEDPT